MAALWLIVDLMQVCPDFSNFSADEFTLYRNALAAGLNITADQAVENLATSWTVQTPPRRPPGHSSWKLTLQLSS